MPLYKKDPKLDISQKDVEQMLEMVHSKEHRIAIILLYLTGARPSEILSLTKQDFIILENELKIKIKTLKRGLDRTLIFDRLSTPFATELIAYVNNLARDKLFSFSSDARLRQIVYKASGNRFTPYTFRHNRHYKLAELGATPYELMSWKGSRSMESVAPYVMKAGQMIEKLKDKIR
ncbi:MAG: site-specific integrase [Candidatus Aenigmatarchaeota archaeon]